MMTLEEYKAWFEGFCEAIDGAPTVEQFERIKVKLAETTALRVSDPHKFGRLPCPPYVGGGVVVQSQNDGKTRYVT